MARNFSRTLFWVAWSVPPTALFAALYIGVVVPVWVGSEPNLGGNLASLAIAALSASALSPFCILPWFALAHVVPSIERSPSILALAFVVWVCLLGEITTVLVYGEQPALIGLVPFALGATAVVSPRFLVPSLGVSSSTRVTSH